MRPRDSIAILGGYVLFSTIVAFAIGAFIGGRYIAIASAVATLLITVGASIAARHDSWSARVFTSSHLLDSLIVALILVSLTSLVIVWLTGEFIVPVLSIASLLSVVAVRAIGSRRRGGEV